MAFRPYFTQGVDEPEWAVWLAVVLALVVGAVLYGTVTGRTVEAAYAGGRLSVPAAWIPAPEPGADLALVDMGGRTHGARASVRTVAHTDLFADSTGGAEATLADAARAWSMGRGRGLTGYRVLATEATDGPAGRTAHRLTYAYLEEPAGAGGLPTLVQAEDVLVETGPAFQVLTISVPSDAFDATAGLRQRLVAGWRPETTVATPTAPATRPTPERTAPTDSTPSPASR